jgi:AraC family transcriptional activator of pobA
MSNKQPLRLKTIHQYHKLMGLPKPDHPHVSVINIGDIKTFPFEESISLVYDFYCIALKTYKNISYKYGQQKNDLEDGVLFFMAPNQVITIEIDKLSEVKAAGQLLFVHPDLLWNTSLAKSINKYDFFDYSANEALFLSEKEELKILLILQNIQQEYQGNIDNFSEDVIIAQLELLLTYADRYYHRQFLTQKLSNHKTLIILEEILDDYFKGNDLSSKGLPSVQFISDQLNISQSYLSRLLKTLTGQSTQQHIHEKLIARAKEKLSTTTLSVSEIAYELGFEHSQSFSKLFKTKTNFSPLEFRQSFN